MKKIIGFIIFGMILTVWILQFVSAHCPLCTTGAAVGIGVTRFYGVDDSIVGLFFGALIVSSVLWFNRWLLKKKINFPLQKSLIISISFLLFVVPLYFTGIITDFEMVKSMPNYHSMLGLGVLGIDRLLFGIITGTLAVLGAFSFNEYIKKRRGKVLFPYQGITFMLITLAVFSLIFWFITK